MGVDLTNHLFAPGLSPGWTDRQILMGSRTVVKAPYGCSAEDSSTNLVLE